MWLTQSLSATAARPSSRSPTRTAPFPGTPYAANSSGAAEAAGLGRTTPHQLRHAYATAVVNAGVSLQALMALLGHVSAAMSLRSGRLFDASVRQEYERALTLAKQHLGATPSTRTSLPLTDITGGADLK